MFNLSRFNRLVQWTIQCSPIWYLFLHFAACILMTIVVLFIFDEVTNVHSGPIPFVEPAQFLYGFGWVNGIVMIPIAAHFVSRHFKNDRETTDYLTLPVSSLERYLVLFLGLFVVLPAIAWLSSLCYFFAVQLFGGDLLFPHLKWMWSLFTLALLPYYAGAVAFFALGLIRPQRTFLWGLGISVVIIAVVAVVIQTVFNQESVNVPLDHLANLVSPDNLFGPTLHGREHVSISTGNAIFDSVPWLIATIIASALLFLTSAWHSLRTKEV